MVIGDTTICPSSVDDGGDGTRSTMELESLARVDMKEFTQSELYSLARSSFSDLDLQSAENLVIPNVSSDFPPPHSTTTATTTSPSKIFAFSHRRGPRRRISASINDESDPQLIENRLILSSLQKLIAEGDANDSNPRNDMVMADNEGGAQRRKRRRKSKAAEENEEEFEGLDVINLNGEEIDLKFLARVADGAFEAELKRMTEGMVREDEFLGFMKDLEGRWGSSRKRRKYVDAAYFIKALPVNWKILLSLRPRIRQPSLYCRRFVSPSDVHFKSCKDVAFYLKSQFETNDVNPPVEGATIKIEPDCQVIESVGQVPRSSFPDTEVVEEMQMEPLQDPKQRIELNGEGSSKGVQDPSTEQKNGSEAKKKLKTRCMWCLVEFFREPGDEETLTDSCAFKCPKCEEEIKQRVKSTLSRLNQRADK